MLRGCFSHSQGVGAEGALLSRSKAFLNDTSMLNPWCNSWTNLSFFGRLRWTFLGISPKFHRKRQRLLRCAAMWINIFLDFDAGFRYVSPPPIHPPSYVSGSFAPMYVLLGFSARTSPTTGILQQSSSYVVNICNLQSFEIVLLFASVKRAFLTFSPESFPTFRPYDQSRLVSGICWVLGIIECGLFSFFSNWLVTFFSVFRTGGTGPYEEVVSNTASSQDISQNIQWVRKRCEYFFEVSAFSLPSLPLFHAMIVKIETYTI